MIAQHSRDIFVIFFCNIHHFLSMCLISIAGEGEIETIKEEHDDNDDQEQPVVSFLFLSFLTVIKAPVGGPYLVSYTKP